MSDESFDVKLNVLKSSGSKFKILNDDVIKLDRFTEDEILKRERHLEEIIKKRYHLDGVSIDGIRFENTVEVICTQEADPIFIGSTPVAFKLIGREIPVTSFAKLIIEVVKLLHANYPEKIVELAKKGYNPWNDADDAKKCLYYQKQPDEKDMTVGEDINIVTTFSANDCVQFCVRIMKECGLEADQLLVYLKADSIKKQNTIKKADQITMVRRALKELGDEGLIIYDRATLPPSDSYIKFLDKTIDKVLPAGEVSTEWDGENYRSIYYLEYMIQRHRIILSFKRIPETEKYAKVFREFAAEGIVSKKEQTFWHTKKERIDFEKVAGAPDSIIELKTQIAEAVKNLEEFALKVDQRLKSM